MGVNAQQNNESSNKRTYPWVVENNLTEAEKRNRNSKSWPFKVVKKGDPQFKCITSLSDLENSFNNTKYTKLSAPSIDGRYGLIYCILSKLGKKTENIKYLYINFDTVFYIDKEGNSHGIKYGNQLTAALENIALGLLYSSGVITEVLRVNKQKYDRYKLQSLVEEYLNARVNMKFLSDEGKYITDIFKSDISFRNLEYLVFSTAPLKAVDFQVYVKARVEKFLSDYNIKETPQLEKLITNYVEKLITNYVSLDNEVSHMKKVREIIESGEKIEGICKVKYVDVLEDSKSYSYEEIKKYFIDLKSEEDKKEEQRKYKALKQSLDSEGTAYRIYNMIRIMNRMYAMTSDVGKYAILNNSVEYPIWVEGNYTDNTVKTRLNLLYNHIKRKNLDIPIFGVLSEVFKFYGIKNYDIEFGKMKEYIPENFKNDRHTFQSYGCNFETKEGIQKIKETIIEIKKNFFYLYETFLGLELAMFGKFMVRFGAKNAWLAKKLVKTLDDKYTPDNPFYLSKNVNEQANRAFYLISCPKAFENGEFNAEDIERNMGDKLYFVKYYLDLLISDTRIDYSSEARDFDESNEQYVKTVSHSDYPNSEEDFVRMKCLLKITEGVIDILLECLKLVKCEEYDITGIKNILSGSSELRGEYNGSTI